MKAKDYLLNLSKFNIEIENLESEIVVWRSFEEEKSLRKAEKQLETKRKLRSDALHKMIESLKKLPPIECNVLTMRFVGVDNDGSGKLKTMTLQEIADHYKKEYTWVTTTQGRALKHLQQIIDRGELHE